MQLKPRYLTTLGAGVALAALVGCAQTPMQPMYPAATAPAYPGQPAYPAQPAYPGQPAYANFGRVTNVEYLRGGQSSGVAGAVIGGAVGGLAGNQVGGGTGRAAATVVGVVGGALIGRALEQNMNRGGNAEYYRVTVQFDNGTARSFDYAQPPNVQIGDRVRADGDQLYR